MTLWDSQSLVLISECLNEIRIFTLGVICVFDRENVKTRPITYI